MEENGIYSDWRLIQADVENTSPTRVKLTRLPTVEGQPQRWATVLPGVEEIQFDDSVSDLSPDFKYSVFWYPYENDWPATMKMAAESVQSLVQIDLWSRGEDPSWPKCNCGQGTYMTVDAEWSSETDGIVYWKCDICESKAPLGELFDMCATADSK